MNEQQRRDLLDAAIEARRRAYAPYSKFPVGAALLTAGGKIIAGCNVENASYGLTMCAERLAVGGAVAAGHRTLAALAVAAPGAAPPCGACRQVLAEFARDLPILLVEPDDPDRIVETNLATLLPAAFAPENLAAPS